MLTATILLRTLYVRNSLNLNFTKVLMNIKFQWDSDKSIANYKKQIHHHNFDMMISESEIGGSISTS